MDAFYLLFIVCVFTAAALACEGAYTLWRERRGPEAQRLARRLRAMSAGAHSAPLLKPESAAGLSPWERRLLALPHARQLERLLQQAGSQEPASHVVLKCLGAALAAWLGTRALAAPVILALAASLAAGAAFPVHLALRRRRRLNDFARQLPEALGVISRALRAGHAFSSALGMVADEASEPLAGEFRTTFDEINFGLPLREALLNLGARVPSTDLRYVIIAVLLQRETGGNLAELLDTLAALIRERFELLGKVRVLSAEGRLSAWILGALPWCTAAAVHAVNPKFMRVLWTDPAGWSLVRAALVLSLIGVLWMWRVVKIRV